MVGVLVVGSRRVAFRRLPHGGVVGIEFLRTDEAIAIAVDRGKPIRLATVRRREFGTRNPAVVIGVDLGEAVFMTTVHGVIFRRGLRLTGS